MKQSTPKMTLTSARSFLQKIDEWDSVKHLPSDCLIDWAQYLKYILKATEENPYPKAPNANTNPA